MDPQRRKLLRDKITQTTFLGRGLSAVGRGLLNIKDSRANRANINIRVCLIDCTSDCTEALGNLANEIAGEAQIKLFYHNVFKEYYKY